MTTLPQLTLSEWREHGREFVFSGHRMRFWTAGSQDAEPLLLIHGFPTASWDWHYLWLPLARRYRLMAVDMLGFGDSAKPAHHAYSLLEQADVQLALLTHLGVYGPVHILAHDYGDSVAQELLARHQERRLQVASCVFLNGGLFPETHRPVLVQKLLLSPLGPFLGRLFNRRQLAASFGKIFGANTQPSSAELDDFWQLIEHNHGQTVLHRLIRYIPERRVQRERWLKAMQHSGVPQRLIVGAADPISGEHMQRRYCQLIADADTVLLDCIGHYPQVEAATEVLAHYLAFRQDLTAD